MQKIVYSDLIKRFKDKGNFDKNTNAAQALEIICATLSKAITRRWFSHFRSGYFDVEVFPGTGRPIWKNIYEIIAKVEQDRPVNVYDIDKELKLHYQAVLNNPQKADYEKNVILLVHGLTDRNFSIRENLIKRNKIDPFLRTTKSGTDMTTMCQKDRGLNLEKLHNLRQSAD